MIKKFYIISVILVFGFHVFSQSLNTEIQIITDKSLPSEFKVKKNTIYTFQSHGSVEQDISKFLNRLYDNGYLESSVDSVITENQTARVFLSLGRQFQWFSLNIPSEKSNFNIKIPRKFIPLNNSIWSLEKYLRLREYIIGEYENQGYPFASIKLDSIQINDSIIKASLGIDAGNRVKIDTIIVRSELPLSNRILHRVSGLKMGDWYSEKKLISAQKRLQKSGFIGNQKSLEVGFFDDKAWVYLNPEIQKKNRIDGLVGIQPTQGSGVPAIAGEFNLFLKNLFRQTESLTIQWKAPGGATQKLFSQIAIPYFLGLPIGISAQVSLYKKDTSYLNLGLSAGIRVSFQPDIWMDALFENRSSSRLAKGLNNSFPEYDLKLSKLIFNYDNRDNSLNPRSGWQVRQEAAYGRKTTDSQLVSDQQSNYWELGTKMSLFIPIKQNWTFLLAIDGGYRSGLLAANEQFRIGGFNLMRGFQEESLLAGKYAVATTEVRLLFTGLSNIHLFFDWSIIDNDYAYSPGMGLSIQTKAGILRLDYAIGQFFGEEFDIQKGLIHLGIQSIF